MNEAQEALYNLGQYIGCHVQPTDSVENMGKRLREYHSWYENYIRYGERQAVLREMTEEMESKMHADICNKHFTAGWEDCLNTITASVKERRSSFQPVSSSSQPSEP